MEEKNEWRFPSNNYMPENGLDTSDMETFKKDPIASLAREICQNSIDACHDNKKVRVEFNLFEVDRNKIPGIDALTEQIHKCVEFKKESSKESKSLQAMQKAIQKERIKCLRISDFNTIGASGGKDNVKDSPFYNLTKGAGISEKMCGSGGSKGIGKFASFVVSKTNTVFYSTYAADGSHVHIGISKLRSVPCDKNDPDLLTGGIGYYARNKKNYAIEGELQLDNKFKRSTYGTDIYIIGFPDNVSWEIEMAAKIMESFMVAIMNNHLDVDVNHKFQITRENIKNIIDCDEFNKRIGKKEQKDIKAQYAMLEADDSVTIVDLDVKGEKIGTLRVKEYSFEDDDNAIKHCIMVRYPYMKIRNLTTGRYLPYSALCVIENNTANEKLRAIENPQHTDWEINRLNDDPDEKKATKSLKKEIEDLINKKIRETLKKNSEEETDMAGAGQFLPAEGIVGKFEGNNSLSDSQIIIGNIVKNKPQNPKTEKNGDNGDGYDFDEGTSDDNGEDVGKTPAAGSGSPKPNPNTKGAPGDDPKVGNGNNSVLKKVPLSGIKYTNIVINKLKGEYNCVFEAPSTEKSCDFAVWMYGALTDKYPVEIVRATMNGISCSIKEGKVVGFRIKKGKTYTISYEVNSNELFSSEVEMNAYRK